MGEFRTSGGTRPVAAAVTDVGRQRKHNEDHVLVKTELGLFVVADGMGGHNAGNVASALATTSIDNFFEATKFGDLPGPIPADEIELQPEARRIVAGIRKANLDVFQISSTHAQHQGMGSTVVAAYVSRETDQIHVGHVGDSRCYRIRDGKLEQLTKDHSLINDALALKPDLSPEELARLPKNIITRALGMKDAVKVDIRSEKVQPGDIFLLCSDGLSGMVSDAQIADVFEFTEDPREACELLIAMANEAGGNDNISALIIRIEPADETDERSLKRNATTQPHRIDELGSVLPPESEGGGPAQELDLGLPEGGLDGDITLPLGAPKRRPTKPPVPHVAAPEEQGDGPALPLVTARKKSGISGRYAAVATGDRPVSADAPATAPMPSPKARRQVEVRVARCPHCNFELFIGNSFCVECGAPIKV
ncbi:MAG: Stp1/IreP family PP2C-type Ser/Thr phosphatase [Polyangiaceae bacterium]|nr:Stp1/IreP family PP2C-type Ser/Thr phosphatase [Polyangiaceae bacterium]